MCGIAGYIGRREISPDRRAQCLRLMGRRGPDHADQYAHTTDRGENVYLLHSRLRIIDLDERANQPMRDDGHVMIYNGELYNYVELRDELVAQGEVFHTSSDTEVLLRIMKREGRSGLTRCEGMWAFAVYHEQSGQLLLSRDRFGEKPLFLCEADDGVYFGSEVKFIQALCPDKLQVDMEHIYRYMVYGYKSLYKGNRSFFSGVRELPSASTIAYGPGAAAEPQRYWEPAYRPDEAMNYDDAVEGAREHITRSMKLRLRADVPLAFCMSGGIDSNTLISTAKKTFDYEVHGFTISNEDERYEESEMVECSVKELGLRHTSVPVQTTEFLPRLRTLVRQHDAPVYTITYYAHWLLMQSIAEHGYRISVSGSAADELFSGYYDHHLAYLYEVRDDRQLYEASLKAWETYIKPIVRNPFLSTPTLFIDDAQFREHLYLNADEFAGFLKTPWAESFTETAYTDALLRNRMMNEMFAENVPVILHEDDLNAMYYSIENRSPFLDRDLFEFCNTIPTRHLIKDGCAKAVLRDSMKGIIPEPVRTNRRKVGFNAPIFSFLDVHDSTVKGALLDDSEIYEHIQKSAIENIITKERLPNSESKFLFYFLNAKMFLEEFAA